MKKTRALMNFDMAALGVSRDCHILLFLPEIIGTKPAFSYILCPDPPSWRDVVKAHCNTGGRRGSKSKSAI